MANSQMEQLLTDNTYVTIPKVGDLVKGRVLSTKGREIRVDINGLMVGVVRGRELFTEAEVYKNLNAGDTVEATVVDLENENGEM